MALPVSRLLVREILRASEAHPAAFEWSLQGFGMFRLYLSPDARLHVWSPDHRVPHVSDVHDHPWSFASYIFAGAIANTVYSEVPYSGLDEPEGALFLGAKLRCGPGGGLVEPPRPACLRLDSFAVHRPGEVYSLRWDQLHRSDAAPGTVTLILREARPDPEHARVYWPPTNVWVSAEPRPAEPSEIRAAMRAALAQLNAAEAADAALAPTISPRG